MLISDTMNLADLAAIMGSGHANADAATMRDLLVEQYNGHDTAEIAAAGWEDLVWEATACTQPANLADLLTDGQLCEHYGIWIASGDCDPDCADTGEFNVTWHHGDFSDLAQSLPGAGTLKDAERLAVEAFNLRRLFELEGLAGVDLPRLVNSQRAFDSWVAAHQYARNDGCTPEDAIYDQRVYVGRLLYASEHHIVQHAGSGKAVVHDKHRLAAILRQGRCSFPPGLSVVSR